MRSSQGRSWESSYDVYNELGFGFLESVYEQAMMIALQSANVQVDRQVPIQVWFRGIQIGDFRADWIVEGSILLEWKSARAIDPAHEAQLLNDLKATAIEAGLILNFGPKPDFKRLAFANQRKKALKSPEERAVEKGRLASGGLDNPAWTSEAFWRFRKRPFLSDPC
jgi:GxxExxY protein